MICARDGCERPVAKGRRRYCSHECQRKVDHQRKAERSKRRYAEDPEYRLLQQRKRHQTYEAERADPERWARRQAYMREYHRTHREQARRYQREYRQRLLDDERRLAVRRAREADRMRRRRAEDPELYRQRAREAYARLRANPEAWQRQLAWQRMHYRLRAMREGRPIPELSVEAYERRNGATHSGTRLDPEPLAGWVQRWLAEDPDRDYAMLARAAGVPERRIYGVLHGERASVHTADRLALGVGLHLGLIYDLDELKAGRP